MLSAGIGQISVKHTKKKELEEGDLIIVLGGPGFLIGLGGGSISSLNSGQVSDEQDFSIQRYTCSTLDVEEGKHRISVLTYIITCG